MIEIKRNVVCCVIIGLIIFLIFILGIYYYYYYTDEDSSNIIPSNITNQTLFLFVPETYGFTEIEKPFGLDDFDISFDIKTIYRFGYIMSLGDPGPQGTGCTSVTGSCINPISFIYLVGNDIWFVYATKEGYISLQSKITVTDNKWHNVNINKKGNIWTMTIDTDNLTASSFDFKIPIPPTKMFFGYPPYPMSPGEKPIPSVFCINNITINGILLLYLETNRDIVNEC